nr:deaminase [Blattabacterium cuenoti]
MSNGYNNTPKEFDTLCEDKHGNTKWYVLHAEANAILKLSSSSLSCTNSSLYITHFPCKECSKLIYQSKIQRIVYLYDNENDNIEEQLIFFKKAKILINKFI